MEDPGLPPRLHEAMEQEARPHEMYRPLPAPIGFNGRLQVYRDAGGNAIALYEGQPLAEFLAVKLLADGRNGRGLMVEMEFCE